MDYSVLAETYDSLERNPSKLKKTEIVSELLKRTPAGELSEIVLLLDGSVFPAQSQEELGIAAKMMVRAIAKTTGFGEKEIVRRFKSSGDLGIVAEECIKSKKQATLLRKKLSADMVFENLKKLPAVSGKGSQDKKLSLIAEILSSATPKEARYVVRTVLGTLRVGVAEGILRDAIAKAFGVSAGVVETAWNMQPDYGEVARIAKQSGEAGLRKVRLKVGTSVQVLLAEKAPDLKTALGKFGRAALEYKYDGARIQIHKDGDRIRLFTRRLEDVTKQFPDMVSLARQGLRPRTCIVDGEVLAIDAKTGKPMPFQQLSQRIQRKYEIEKMTREIPIQVNLFDVIYVDGREMFDTPFSERRKTLEEIVKVSREKFQLARQLVTDDLKKAEAFYKAALNDNQEGLIVKNLDSKYQPGKRVGYWLKVKPIMETLDLAIIGAEWGMGRRANWLSSFILACRDPNSGKFLSCGMMGTGLTDEQFKEMTKKLKSLIVEERGRSVEVRPKIVVEVGYEEIQKSPTYESGYALRFPRLIRERTDKGPDEADTIDRVKSLFKSQGKRG